MEKVYENAMFIELQKAGLSVQQQAPIAVHYDGKQVGEYYADLLIENRLICELKAGQAIAPEHELQLVNYLAATSLDTGLLLDFGNSVTVKRKFRKYRRPDLSLASGSNPVNPEKSC